MDENIDLLRQRLHELRNEVRILVEDRQRLQLENSNLRGELRDIHAANLRAHQLRAPLSPSLSNDPYWIEAIKACG